MCPAGPWNRCGWLGLSSGRDRSGRPSLRPVVARLAAGVTVLWFLGRQVGAAPFEDGLRAVTWQAVVAAVTLTALTTVCSAWRLAGGVFADSGSLAAIQEAPSAAPRGGCA
jgi:hypothetical protein